MTAGRSWAWWCLSALLAQGCALFSKSEPITPRYFSPERPEDRPRAGPSSGASAGELRLGQVDSATNLDELLVFRDSGNEVGYHRLRRWTEAPERYLSRRLARVLFEERGLREAVSGAGPTLDVHLIAFEEVRGPEPTARVQAIVRFRDAGQVRWQQTVTVEEPIRRPGGGDEAAAAVDALGAALRGTVEQIADRVMRELALVSLARRP